MKRFFSAAAALVLLASLCAASAGGGTAQDPLVSQSYVDGDYTDAVLQKGKTAIDSALEDVYADAVAQYEKRGGGKQYDFSSGFTGFILPANKAAELAFGSSAVLTQGTAVLSVNAGSVVDVSTGEELTGSFRMEKNRRYFCCEDADVTVTAAERAVVNVNGRYLAPDAEAIFTHYRDVNPANWYYDAAKYVYDNRLYHDYDAAEFGQAVNTTRAELVFALWSACGRPAPQNAATFDDIEPGWYFDAASWAAENDIVRGYSGNKYMPFNSITRQEIAVIMYRYAGYMGYSTSGERDLSPYIDEGEIADWAKREMSWANAEGLITGTTNVNLAPLKTAWRSEVATIIMRYLESR